MRYTLQNSYLTVEIESLGAEIKSVKNRTTDLEYMWQGEKRYWGRTAPILFPFVGSLTDKAFRYQGTTYSMGQHGFARDMEFTLIAHTEEQITFALESSEETIRQYPFPFRLEIEYTLTERDLRVAWTVVNPGKTVLPFSIGAHPAFNCPVHGESTKEGYRLVFPGMKEIHHYGNSNETGLALTYEDLTLPLTNSTAVITPDFFDRCTYIVDNDQTGEVGIMDPQGNTYVSMTFHMPLFALWSPEKKNAPFLCIEPWCGRCDAEGFHGDLTDREHGNLLAPGASWYQSYTITYR